MTPNAYGHLENDTLRIDVEYEKKLQVVLLPVNTPPLALRAARVSA